jgi:hypothetical protein
MSPVASATPSARTSGVTGVAAQLITPSVTWAFAVDVKASTMNISASKTEVFFKAAIFLSFYPQEVYVTYVSLFSLPKMCQIRLPREKPA